MDRLKDNLKEFFEEHKLKIVLGLLATIVGLMVILFVMMGQHDDNQSLNSSAENSNLSTQNLRASKSPQKGSTNHFQSTFIDIEGAVKRPGVYQFTNNMRVDDAVNLAGGLNRSADRRHINLAKKLSDQQTVYIPIKGEIKGLPGNSGSGSSNSESLSSSDQSQSHDNSKVNLNSADDKQLESVNGIGEKRAQKIIEYRKDHGNFKQINDLKNVSGVGDKFINNIKDQVTV